MTQISAAIGPVFYRLVYMSLTALVAGASVLLIRRLADKRFSPFWKYAMWILVLAALVMPWRPQSRAAVLSPVEAVQEFSYREEYNQAQANYSAALTQASQETPEIAAARSEAAVLRAKTLAVDELLPLLWLCGMAGVAAFMEISAVRLRRGVRRSQISDDMARYEALLERCKQRLGVKRRVRIVLQSHMGTPALMGLLRPVILLPGYATDMSDEHLEYVILHEISHLRRGDHLVNALLLALRAVYWFNPLVWLLFKFIREDMELANDAAVLRGMGQEAQKEYSRSLLEVLMGSADVTRRRHTMLCMADGKKNIERRIGMIQMGDFFKKRKWIIAVAGVLVIAVIAALFLTAGVKRGDRYDFHGAGVTVTARLPKGMEIPEGGTVGDQYTLGLKEMFRGEQRIGELSVEFLDEVAEEHKDFFLEDPEKNFRALFQMLPMGSITFADDKSYRLVRISDDGGEGSATIVIHTKDEMKPGESNAAVGAHPQTKLAMAYNLALNRATYAAFDYDALSDEELAAVAESLRLQELPPEQRKSETRLFRHEDLLLEITSTASVHRMFENEGTDEQRMVAVYTIMPGAELRVVEAKEPIELYVHGPSITSGGEPDGRMSLADNMLMTIMPDMTGVYDKDGAVLHFAMKEPPPERRKPDGRYFPMQGANLSDLQSDEIIRYIVEITGAADDNIMVPVSTFGLHVTDDFDWHMDNTIAMTLSKKGLFGARSYGCQLRIMDDSRFYVTSVGKTTPSGSQYKLKDYLDALKYLPQVVQGQWDLYSINIVEYEKGLDFAALDSSNPSYIFYNKYGVIQPQSDWQLTLQIQPMKRSGQNDSYEGAGADTMHLFYVAEPETPALSPTFLSLEEGLEAIKPLIWGSDGWWVDAKGDYIFAHFWRHILRYDARTNRIDKIIDLGYAPQYWYYGVSFSPIGQYCVAQAQEFDGRGQTGRLLIDLKNEIVTETVREHYPHSTQSAPCEVETRYMEDGHRWFVNDKEITALRPYAGMIAEVIAMDESRVGALLPIDGAGGYLGYYKFAVIDLAQDEIIQECPMNVLARGEEYPTYPSELTSEPPGVQSTAPSTTTTVPTSRPKPALILSREIEKDGLLLRVYSDFQYIFTGEPFTLTASITNTTGRDITYAAGSSTLNMHREIKVSIPGKGNYHFTDMDTWSKIQLLDYRTATLKAGETYTQTIRFLPGAPLGDLRTELSKQEMNWFPAGEYTGTAVFAWHSDGTEVTPHNANLLELEFPIMLI